MSSISFSELIIKAIGIVLAIVGACVLLSIVGVTLFGISLQPVLLAIVVGAGLLFLGVYIVRGGNFVP